MNLPWCNCGHFLVVGKPQSQFASLHGYCQSSTRYLISSLSHILDEMKSFWTFCFAKYLQKQEINKPYWGNLDKLTDDVRGEQRVAYSKHPEHTVWCAELTLVGPGLDCDWTFISGEGIVKQVDLTVHLSIDDHRVSHCAVVEHQQIIGAVLHRCCYPERNRRQRMLQINLSMRWIRAGGSLNLLTHLSHGSLGSRLWIPAGPLPRNCKLMCSISAQGLSIPVVWNQNDTASACLCSLENMLALTIVACRRLIRRRFFVSCEKN